MRKLGALLVVHHVEVDRDRTGAGDVGDGLGDAIGDLGAHRAAGGRQVDLDVDAAVVADVDALDHSEVGDGLADLRILDPCERASDFGLVGLPW